MRLDSKLLYSDNKDTSLKKVKTKMKNKCFFVDFSVLRFKKMNPSALYVVLITHHAPVSATTNHL